MTVEQRIARLRECSSRKRFPVALRDLGYRKLCEVGVFKGSNLKSWLQTDPVMVVGIDLWSDHIGDYGTNDRRLPQLILDTFYRDMLHLQWADPRVFILRMLSSQAAKLFTPGFFDFVYLDGDHTRAGVTADIDNWWPLVRSGGMLAGHDFKSKYSVRYAVTDWVERDGLQDNFHVSHERCPNWYVVKS